MLMQKTHRSQMKILFLPQKIQQLNRKVVFCLRKVLNTILCTTIEARSFNSSEKKTSKNYFVEKLEPGKKLNVNVAYVAEDKQLNEYKDQLYLMTVLSGNPLGEGTMQVIKSEK